MATKKPKKGPAWADDHDDAHFSDNPAVPKRHKRKRVGGKIRTGASGRTGKYVGAKKKSRKRVAGK